MLFTNVILQRGMQDLVLDKIVIVFTAKILISFVLISTDGLSVMCCLIFFSVYTGCFIISGTLLTTNKSLGIKC